MENNNIRLSQDTIELIRNHVLKADKNGEVYIFGSRADPLKKGGDIDILVISKTFNFYDAQKLRIAIQDLIGEQKIDVVYTTDKTSDPFVRIVLEKAVKL